METRNPPFEGGRVFKTFGGVLEIDEVQYGRAMIKNNEEHN